MLRTRSKAAQDVREVRRGHIDVIAVVKESAVADVMFVTAPQLALLVVGTVDEMTIPGHSNDLPIS